MLDRDAVLNSGPLGFSILHASFFFSSPFFVCSRAVKDEGVFDSQSLYLRLYPSLIQFDDVEPFIRRRPLLTARYVAQLRRGRPREVSCGFSVQVSSLSRARVVQTEVVKKTSGPAKEPH